MSRHSFGQHGDPTTSPMKISRKRKCVPAVLKELRKKLQALRRPATQPTNFERISQVGRKFPFMERSDLYEQVWQAFHKEQQCYEANTTDRPDWPLHAIVGTCGSGKTRFMAEVLRQPHPSVADHFEHYLYIHATYNNGNEVTDLDRLAPARCLALRLLYHYFIEGPQDMRLNIMLANMYKITKHLDNTAFTVHTALELIREDYIQANKLDSDAIVTVAIGVDEYNKFLTDDPQKSSTAEIRAIIESLAAARLRPPKRTRVCVLLAGTSRDSIVDAGLNSTCTIYPLRLDPLSEASALSITADYFKTQYVYTNACLRNILLDIGGHPRLLEWLVREMNKYSSTWEVKWPEVRQSLAKTMASNWAGTKNTPLLESVIITMFKRKSASTADLVPGSTSVTYDWLEQRELGLRFDRYSVPYWPHLCLQAWTSEFHGTRPHFHSALQHTLSCCTDGELFTWQHFECFCAQYLALRIAAFGEGTTELSDLLRGALMAKGVKGYEVSVPSESKRGSGRVLMSNKTFPSKRSLIDENGVPIEWSHTGRVVVNNDGAPFDFFVHLDNADPKQGYFICGQTKYYKHTQLTLDQVQHEVTKVKRAMRRAQLKQWLVLIVTTAQCDITADQLPARCALVSAREFEAFYTKPFAERLSKYVHYLH